MRDSTPVPILNYHSLDETGSVISVTPQTFEHHMADLQRRGFEAVSLTHLLEAWNGTVPLPERPVVLTFDDGFTNFLECAAPLLKKFKFSATIFVIPGYAGRTNDWPSQPSEIPQMPLLSWSDMRDLVQQGFEIGCHTMTHKPLSRLGPKDLQHEIVNSKSLLEDQLSQSVTTFAYPYGIFDPQSRRLVQSHYSGACGVKLNLARRIDDRYQLSRVDTYYLRSVGIFRMLGTPWGSAYLHLRHAGRTLYGIPQVTSHQEI